MKPRTFFGMALLIPYIIWVICALAVVILSSLQETSPVWDSILAVVFFYAFGILFWFVPYTILAVGMWIWSRDKPTSKLYKLGLTAPILLLPFMVVEAVLLSLPVDNIVELAGSTINQSLLLGGLSLVFGYLCVGIALGVYKFLRAKRLIADEIPESI